VPSAPIFDVLRWLTRGPGRALPVRTKYLAAVLGSTFNKATQTSRPTIEGLMAMTGESRSVVFRGLVALCGPGGPFVKVRSGGGLKLSNVYGLNLETLNGVWPDTLSGHSADPKRCQAEAQTVSPAGRNGVSPATHTDLGSDLENRPGKRGPDGPLGRARPAGRAKTRAEAFQGIWKLSYGEESVAPHYQRIGKALKTPEAKMLTDRQLLRRWRAYLVETQPQHASIEGFMRALGTWGHADAWPVKGFSPRDEQDEAEEAAHCAATATVAPTATAPGPVEVEAVVVREAPGPATWGGLLLAPERDSSKADRYRQRGEALVREFANYLDRVVAELRAPWPGQAIQRWRSETGTDERETAEHEVLRRALEIVTAWRQQGGATA
jgi:hypothetical protein